MGKRHIKSAIQAITGGYMPPGEVMDLARRFRDIPIFPEKPKDWDKLPARERKALEEAKRRYEKVLAYRRLLAAGNSRKEAARLLGCGRDALRRWDENEREGGQMGLLPRSRARENSPSRLAIPTLPSRLAEKPHPSEFLIAQHYPTHSVAVLPLPAPFAGG